MSHKPRPWPNIAKEARDRAAEEAVSGLRILEPLLIKDEYTRDEQIRRIAIAVTKFQTIARILESVGAQTRP